MGTDLQSNSVATVDDMPGVLRTMAATHPVVQISLNPYLALQLARRIDDAAKAKADLCLLLETRQQAVQSLDEAYQRCIDLKAKCDAALRKSILCVCLGGLLGAVCVALLVAQQ